MRSAFTFSGNLFAIDFKDIKIKKLKKKINLKDVEINEIFAYFNMIVKNIIIILKLIDLFLRERYLI